MRKHEKILKTYRRNHSGRFAGEQERSKIERAKQSVRKMMRKADQIDVLDDESGEAYDDLMTQMKKAQGSRKGHEQRLTELEQNDDFE